MVQMNGDMTIYSLENLFLGDIARKISSFKCAISLVLLV